MEFRVHLFRRFDLIAGALVIASIALAVPQVDAAPPSKANSPSPSVIKPEQRTATPKATKPASRCACGSGKACVGPRGGRYCITTTGRKSYLKR